MPSDLISESAHFQNFLGGHAPDPPSFAMLRMHVCFAHNERTSPLKMPNHLCKGCSSPVNPLTRKGQYTGRFTQCTENAKASILAATTRNQTNSHSFNLVRPRIKVFKYYYSPLNSV